MELKIHEYEGKTLEEVKEEAFADLKVTDKEVLYKSEEKKGKLFKAGSIVLKVATIKDIADFIKENLKELINNMGIEVQLESNIRDEQINIKMYSDNNNILIGKNGQTLNAIQKVLRQQVYNQIGKYPYILLDVENYKEKKMGNLERMAKRTAKEVLKSHVDVTLDDMNSYERRIVHNALTKFKNLSTASEGEEPHRHIVIRYVEKEENEETEDDE
jgi:spoIIIJ-associated protein